MSTVGNFQLSVGITDYIPLHP